MHLPDSGHHGAVLLNLGDIIGACSMFLQGIAPATGTPVLEMNWNSELSCAAVCAADKNAHYKPINWWEFRRKRFEGDYANVGEEVQIEWYRLDGATAAAAANGH